MSIYEEIADVTLKDKIILLISALALMTLLNYIADFFDKKRWGMQGQDIDKHLISYREDSNDYRYVFTREEIAEIKRALDQKSLIEEIKQLVHDETNASTTKN